MHAIEIVATDTIKDADTEMQQQNEIDYENI